MLTDDSQVESDRRYAGKTSRGIDHHATVNAARQRDGGLAMDATPHRRWSASAAPLMPSGLRGQSRH
jgi:hypothetical protein